MLVEYSKINTADWPPAAKVKVQEELPSHKRYMKKMSLVVLIHMLLKICY